MTAADKPTIPEVIERFRAFYERDPSWGVLHIVLADDNVDDSDVRACIDYAREIGDAEGEALAEILLKMSRTQRLKLGDLA